jgi:hypothetical protein
MKRRTTKRRKPQDQDGRTWDEITIEPSRFDTQDRQTFDVYGHGVYDRHSVLAGQSRRCFLNAFATLEEAQAAFPDAQIFGHSTYSTVPAMPSCAPAWFDPAAAGESWGEDY